MAMRIAFDHKKRRGLKGRIFSTLVFAVGIHLLPSAVSAQNRGLAKAQDHSTLPVSLASPAQPVRKKKLAPHTRLAPAGAGEYRIVDGWEMQEAVKAASDGAQISGGRHNSAGWYNATVPGTVLTTLVDEGVYADPFFGLNNLRIPDTLCRQAWWYKTTFSIPAAERHKKAWLVFKGINYRAVVWLNGRQLGGIEGAFRRRLFDISKLVDPAGKNTLAVHIFPPPHPGIPHEESPTAGTGPNGGLLCLDGPTFISSEGWDWIPGIRDRNIGIWQDVVLHFSGDIILSDTRVVTGLPLPDTTSAAISIYSCLHNNSTKTEAVKIEAVIEGVRIVQQVYINGGETKPVIFSPQQFPALMMKNPKLWWPNGYGKQDLYRLQLTVTDAAGIKDRQDVRFGIRELSYELTIDAPQKKNWRVEFDPTATFGKTTMPVFDNAKRRKVIGETFISSLRSDADTAFLRSLPSDETSPYLVIRVNGTRIFCRGGNWGMDDGMKRVTRQKLEPYFKLHREANFNMVRNWTGESTEEVFYELCDEYGLLVWNDFWMSTEGYNLEPLDNELFLANAKDVIVRFRNHPSIALWCPRNEGYAPPLLEDSLAALVAREDGTRYYQANSRYLNLRTSGPWHYIKDPKEYFVNIADGFNTEIGTPSMPSARSMRKMMPEADLWPISDPWYYHDLHRGQKEYCKAIDSLYGTSVGLDDFSKKAQLVNYDSHRAIIEAYNSRLWNHSSGVLLWMTHPAWPSTVWQAYSWDYETFGSYYGLKKACEQTHIQMNLHDSLVVVVNTAVKEIKEATVLFAVFDLSGKKIFEREERKNIPGQSLTPFFKPHLPPSLPGIYLCRLSVTDAEGIILSQNDYWKNGEGGEDFKFFNSLKKPVLKAKLVKRVLGQVELSLTNASAFPAVAVKLSVEDGKGNVLLPAYFSDGYFNLLPGETRSISVTVDGAVSKRLSQVFAEGYNLPPQKILAVHAVE